MSEARTQPTTRRRLCSTRVGRLVSTGAVLITTFSPTHEVPVHSLPAWEQPDPQFAPVAQLDPHLPVRVLIQRPDGWAQIVCANNWQAWVDGRLLMPIRGAVDQRTAASKLAAPILLGIGLTVVGSFLPWYTQSSFSLSAWDVPFTFLLTGDGAGDSWRAGAALLVTAIALIPLLTRRPHRVLTFTAAIVATGLAGLALSRSVFEDQAPDPAIGIGVTLAGGFFLQLASIRAGRVQRSSAGP
jgi:hypothetical protein